MKLSALLQDVETKSFYTADPEITNVTDDTKSVRHGSAFVCLKGSKTDGHSYIAKAVEKGAAVIICEYEVDYENCVQVESTRKAYAIMCANFYGNCHKKMCMIGITGTNGKTTTSYVLKKILEDSGFKVGLIGTVNVIIGNEKYPADLTTPNPSDLHRYFMMMFMAGCDICIMEVSSQALIQNRAFGIKFKCGIFTNLSPEHLDYHKTMKNYATAKAVLMKNSEISVINADDSYADFMQKASSGKSVMFSAKDNAEYSAENVKLSPDGVNYDFVCKKGRYNVSFNTIGMFSVYNTLAALTAADIIGVDVEKAVKAVSEFDGISGRMEHVENSFGLNIIIDFAHTPDSLENALKTLKDIYHGRLITVFGCGGDRDKTKRPVMGEVACKYSDTVFVTSDNPRTEDPEAIINDIASKLTKESLFKITDRTTAIRSALYSAKPGDTVLIAGKGHEKYQISGTQKIYYNEREIIRKLLEDKARF